MCRGLTHRQPVGGTASDPWRRRWDTVFPLLLYRRLSGPRAPCSASYNNNFTQTIPLLPLVNDTLRWLALTNQQRSRLAFLSLLTIRRTREGLSLPKVVSLSSVCSNNFTHLRLLSSAFARTAHLSYFLVSMICFGNAMAAKAIFHIKWIWGILYTCLVFGCREAIFKS